MSSKIIIVKLSFQIAKENIDLLWIQCIYFFQWSNALEMKHSELYHGLIHGIKYDDDHC